MAASKQNMSNLEKPGAPKSYPIPLRKLFVLWVAWAIILIGFQHLVINRYSPARPDEVLMWTAGETQSDSQNDQPTLIDPFLNPLVSWDSEFYLSIALNGYDDPAVRYVQDGETNYSLNYAFLPLYPMLIRGLSVPLALFGLTPIATATLAGTIITLVATLFATIALYDLASHFLGEDGAMRAAFYLLIFPTGFFFAQVYTEGLFVACAFTSLALMRRQRYLAAAIVAGFAVWTRPVGIALAVAIAIHLFIEDARVRGKWWPLNQKMVAKAAALGLIPVGFYVIWWSQLGDGFSYVQEFFFGSQPFGLWQATQAWVNIVPSLWGAPTGWTGDASQTAIYYGLEFVAIVAAVVACWQMRKAVPAVATFSILAWAIAFFGGSPHSMVRYVVVLPVLFLWLAWLGNRPNFDRIWTMISLLLLGLLATLFSFDFWVA